MAWFHYSPEIIAAFPNINGAVVRAWNVDAQHPPTALFEGYSAEQTAVKERLGDMQLSELPALAAWRGAFRGFGVDPTKYRIAAEALLRRLTKKGDIPSINALVDIGNLVSIRYAIPVAVIDQRGVKPPIIVRFARGDERFVNLGQDDDATPQPGEVIFTDQDDAVVARRWCWRQSDSSGAKADSTDLLVTLEAHHTDGAETVRKAAEDFAALLKAYTGAETEIALLNRNNPEY